MNLFAEEINNWEDWERIFQSISVFSPLINQIMQKENLPQENIQNLTPGTNAVFRVGNYVVKIFAPKESGQDQTSDMKTEIFASRYVNGLGIPAPKVIANGIIVDKYNFGYLITEYINGKEFIEVEKNMTDESKIKNGRKLRKICDTMNTPCKSFNNIDIFSDNYIKSRFTEFPESFCIERLSYIKKHRYSENVFVHGDLFGDNVIVADNSELSLYIIDFADAVLAPICYEHALVAIDFFHFDKYLIQGFFEDLSLDEIVDICFNGVLIHNFGSGVITEHLGNPENFNCLDDLKKCIHEKIYM